MAKNPDTKRKFLQNIRTTKANDALISGLTDNIAIGEIAVQIGLSDQQEVSAKTQEVATKTGLWVLAGDATNPTQAVRFPSEARVEEMISGGAVAEVDRIEAAVGLNEDGTYSGKTGTNYLDTATTVEGEINILDNKLGELSGHVADCQYELPKDDNKIVVSLAQVDGKISGTSENITSVKLAGYVVGGDDSSKVANTDTLGDALGKLQGQINGMDKDASAEDGKVVTTVAEADGKVTETKANVKDLQLGGYVKNTGATGDIASTDTINTALSKLENTVAANKISNADGSINVSATASGTDINVNIKTDEHVLAKDGNAGLYTDIKVSGASTEELETLGTNVREAYKLLGSDGTRLGDWIKIYKDSAVANVELGHIGDLLSGTTATTEEGDSATIVPATASTEECLNLVYHLENGKYKLAQVSLEDFLQESEFKDGLQVSGTHEVSVKIDDNSEKDGQATPVSFLTVSQDGVKVDGIKNEIDRKINLLDAPDAAVSGQYVTSVSETNGIISVDRADVSSAPLNGYSKGTDANPVAATDTINQAVSKLENQIDKAKAAATTKVVEGADNVHLTISANTDESDSSVTYTITLFDVASLDDVNQIAQKIGLEGGEKNRTYTHSNTNYLSGTTVKADIEMLDALLGKDETAGTGNSGNTVFNTTNTVAKSISDIKKELAAFKDGLTVSGDSKYIKAEINQTDSAATIGVSAITHVISSSTSGSSALVDSWDAKQNLVHKIVDNTTGANKFNVSAEVESDGLTYDFTSLVVDCGTF